MPNPDAPRWDIFCTVVDNYGDAGVCWRLARQLVAEHGLRVRLWIDDLHTLAHLWPGIDPGLDEELVEGVQVCHWREDAEPGVDTVMVIEAFACELPPAYVQAMAARPVPPRWVNLEYLSAEDWVEGCHGLESIHPQTGLHKQFFFPGFTPATGGLLREAGLENRRQAFLAPGGREAFLASLGAPLQADALYLSLFAYPSAPVLPLLQALAAGPGPTVCLVPQGRLLEAVAGFLREGAVQPGQAYRRGALSVVALPFLRQDDYDRLLWACDLNVVRGEDSFVRAQWAARPFIWHIYPQADGAHWPKLAAFRRRCDAGLPEPARQALEALEQGWNAGRLLPADWQALREALPALQEGAETWRAALAAQPDLAARLAQIPPNSL